MQFNFLKTFLGQSLEVKIFSVLVILTIIARIFVLFTLPDTALTDTMYHLTITKYIVQQYTIPFNGIPDLGVVSMPVPLFHILTAGFFILFQLPVNFAIAKVFPFIFSVLQLVLAYFLLKRIFPKNWVFGFAFVAVQPLLIIYGAINYLEILASVTVLLCFFVYWRYVETGRKTFLIAMPFVLMLLAISKESATVLVPVFFLFFLYEIWRKGKSGVKKTIFLWNSGIKNTNFSWIVYFVILSLLLCSAWFALSFMETGQASSTGARMGSWIADSPNSRAPTIEGVFLYPLNFNNGFWFFLQYGFESMPFGISPELAFVAFTLVSFPILMLLLYGLAKGLADRKSPLFKAFLLLAACFSISLLVLLIKGEHFVRIRMLLPVIPLLGIAFCNGFVEIKKLNWKRFFTFLFLLLTFYSIAFSGIYAMHFYTDYNNHVPLYEFIKDLPDESKIIIHGNKTRQIEFIADKEAVSSSYFSGLESEEFYSKLNESGITHLASTCYKNPWNKDVLDELESQGNLVSVFSDDCSNLYGVTR